MSKDKKTDNLILNIDDEFVFVGEPDAGKSKGSLRSKFKDITFHDIDIVSDFLARLRGLSIKQKRISGIIAMLLMCLMCLYYLVFIPRDAITLFLFGTSKLEGVDCYHADVAVEETLNVTKKNIKALKTAKLDSAEIPVKWNKTIDKSGDVEYIVTSANFEFDGKTSEKTKEAFSDGINQYVLDGDKYVAVDREEGETAQFPLASFDLEKLLHVSDATLEDAKFKSEWTECKVRIAGEEATAMLDELLAINPEKERIENGTVVYVFNKRTKELVNIKAKDIEIYEADAKEGDVPISKINLVLTVSDIDNVQPKDVDIPDEKEDNVEIVMDNPDDDSKVKREKVTLSVADMKEKGLSCYTVGTDIGAGSYRIKYKKGMGIVMGMSGKTGAKKFRVCAGYDYYKYDNLGSGKDVKLNDGDKILLAGQDIKVVFSPKS